MIAIAEINRRILGHAPDRGSIVHRETDQPAPLVGVLEIGELGPHFCYRAFQPGVGLLGALGVADVIGASAEQEASVGEQAVIEKHVLRIEGRVLGVPATLAQLVGAHRAGDDDGALQRQRTACNALVQVFGHEAVAGQNDLFRG